MCPIAPCSVRLSRIEKVEAQMSPHSAMKANAAATVPKCVHVKRHFLFVVAADLELLRLLREPPQLGQYHEKFRSDFFHLEADS